MQIGQEIPFRLIPTGRGILESIFFTRTFREYNCKILLYTVPVPGYTLLFQLVIFTGMVRVGVKIPQDGNRANKYEHVAVVRGRVWRALCSVCATGARVAHPSLCNS